MKLLEGKIVIVTGAARGIGEAIALRMAEQGADIAFSFLSSEEKAKALEQKLQSYGVKAKGYKSNAGSYDDCEKFVNEVVAEHGTVDVCINNAGISKDSLLMRLSAAQWDEVMEINLKSVFNMTKQVIRPMMKAKKGSIVNMSSIIGIRGNAGQSSYAASKAGIIGFTKSIAYELGSRNIRCNAIAPGFVETDMTHYLQDEEGAKSFLAKIPLNRFASAAEIADTALFLASDMSSYITGQVISICGGLNI
jgi:3-oxoacyl-[acyl-carrier protein] reductase